MIKLFAILTVLAALPVSALANEVPSNPAAIKCKYNTMKDPAPAVHVADAAAAPADVAAEGR